MQFVKIHRNLLRNVLYWISSSWAGAVTSLILGTRYTGGFAGLTRHTLKQTGLDQHGCIAPKPPHKTGDIQKKRQGYEPLLGVCQITPQLAEWIWVIYSLFHSANNYRASTGAKQAQTAFTLASVPWYVFVPPESKKITGHIMNRPPEKPATLSMTVSP